MDQEEFDAIKEQLKSGNNEYLKVLFEQYGAYCISNVQRKFNCDLEDAEDIFIDAILSFRDKCLRDKISYLTNARNYLYSTCLNMKRQKNYSIKRKKEKEHEVALYLYDENDDLLEFKEKLITLSMRSFNQLGESCQQILRYFYVYKHSMSEIAEKMQLANANTAKVTKARCYKKWLEIVKEGSE